MTEKETQVVSTSVVTASPAALPVTAEREAVIESSSTATMVELAQQVTEAKAEITALKVELAQRPDPATQAQLAEALATVQSLSERLALLENPPEPIEEAEVIEVPEVVPEKPEGVPLAEPQPKAKSGGRFLSLF